jgi:phosphopantothenoylcysteine decarboxylase/phosphopantothenate--cysteine ligase
MTMQNKPKTIVLGITGGVAAYKTAELVRLLVKAQFKVQVVMTEAACQFITPMTMQALSGEPVHVSMWSSQLGNGMLHIELSRHADAILIAPASADFIAKLVHGHADDLLSTLCLARDCPMLVAPAMNKQMWENLATQRNIKQLALDGVTLLGPDSGEQACGEVGLGRMLEPSHMMALLNGFFTEKILLNKQILITAGATMEMIDPVRGITNISSGKMGYALAQVAADMGADVTLISGISTEPKPVGVHFIQTTSADSMYEAVMQHIASQQIFISVAAVADYAPVDRAEHKIKKQSANLSIALKPNKDILAEVANLPIPPFCVGFAAETENLIEYASKKRLAKNIPLIIGNLVSESMGRDDAHISLIDAEGIHTLSAAPKPILANQILHFIHNKIS